MTSSSTSKLALDYYTLVNDVAIISKGFPGWTRTDIMGMSVRMRRYWVKFVLAIAERKPNA